MSIKEEFEEWYIKNTANIRKILMEAYLAGASTQSNRTEEMTKPCDYCKINMIPKNMSVCSMWCAKNSSNTQVSKEGRIEIDKRPKTGEDWKYMMGDIVSITKVDEYGRWFDYIRFDEDGEKKFGKFGQSDIINGYVKKQ